MYEKKVDRRSRKAMAEFLSGHFTHDGIIANRVKFHYLGLSDQQMDKAFQLLEADDSFWPHIWGPVDDFQELFHHRYAIGNSGRSAGYLALHHSRLESTEYQSHCLRCGQRNYRKVAPPLPDDPLERAVASEVLNSGGIWTDETYLHQSAILSLPHTDAEKLSVVSRIKPLWKRFTKDNRCGACGAVGDIGRVNYDRPPMRLAVLGGVKIDTEEMSMDDLRRMTELVVAFDRVCDQVRDQFVDLLTYCEVREETVMVPTTVRSLHCNLA